jgi:hypothetical protein
MLSNELQKSAKSGKMINQQRDRKSVNKTFCRDVENLKKTFIAQILFFRLSGCHFSAEKFSFGRLSGCHFFLVFVRPSCGRGGNRCILSMYFLLRA